MDHLGIDPTIADLGTRLAETAARNTASAVFAKLKAAKAKRDNQATISELEEIVRDLIADRSEALQIAQAYEQELVAQRISDQDIEYINDSVIPLLKKFIDQASQGTDPQAAAKMEAAIDAVAPLLSVETLTVLQLVGFNFKKAIGEPLTLLVQKLITARISPDAQTILEHNRLNAAVSVELLKVAQDDEATARWERLRDHGNAKPENSQ